jgi:hypothetical protein
VPSETGRTDVDPQPNVLKQHNEPSLVDEQESIVTTCADPHDVSTCAVQQVHDYLAALPPPIEHAEDRAVLGELLGQVQAEHGPLPITPDNCSHPTGGLSMPRAQWDALRRVGGECQPCPPYRPVAEWLVLWAAEEAGLRLPRLGLMIVFTGIRDRLILALRCGTPLDPSVPSEWRAGRMCPDTWYLEHQLASGPCDPDPDDGWDHPGWVDGPVLAGYHQTILGHLARLLGEPRVPAWQPPPPPGAPPSGPPPGTPPEGGFYVSIIDGSRNGLLAGPFAEHPAAVALRDPVRHGAHDANPSDAAFAGFGTARLRGDRPGPPGILNQWCGLVVGSDGFVVPVPAEQVWATVRARKREAARTPA